MCSLFAATYPERTLGARDDRHLRQAAVGARLPLGADARRARARSSTRSATSWGGPVGLEVRAPSAAADPAFRDWWATYLRMGASPGAALTLTRMNAEIDIRHVLPAIRVPTLVLHRTDDQCLKVEEGRYVAEPHPGRRVRRAARRRSPAVRRRSGRDARRDRGVPDRPTTTATPTACWPRCSSAHVATAPATRRARRRLRRARAPRDRVVPRPRAGTPATRPSRPPSTGRRAPSAARRRLRRRRAALRPHRARRAAHRRVRRRRRGPARPGASTWRAALGARGRRRARCWCRAR